MNSYIRKMKKVINNPSILIQRLAGKNLIKMDDEAYIKRQFEEIMGYKLDLDNPRTFCEKLNWLKLFDRNPWYNGLVDKYEVKKYICDMIGQEYIIPTLGIYNSFDEIEFDALPEKFVIKCTHDCGSIVIVEDKNMLDRKNVEKLYKKYLKANMFYYAREWVYKDVKPRIIVEKYMKDEKTDELRDYKFYCFNGHIEAVLVATNRLSKEHDLNFDYFDENYNHLPLVNHWHSNASVEPEKPHNFEKMVDIARLLSKDIPHVRVDLYEVNDKVYFGEFTFYDMGGFLKIHPDDWDLQWGEQIDLSLAYKYKN